MGSEMCIRDSPEPFIDSHIVHVQNIPHLLSGQNTTFLRIDQTKMTRPASRVLAALNTHRLILPQMLKKVADAKKIG